MNKIYKKSEQGVGLVEVLVALFILALTVFGFVALQLNSVKTTSESMLRVNGLTLVRDLGDSIRMNPTAMSTYQARINQYNLALNPTSGAASSVPIPTANNRCGLLGGTVTSSNACTPEQKAVMDAYIASKKAFDDGYKIGMANCPGTFTNSPNGTPNVMNTMCLVVSWNNTTPSFGEDDDPSDDLMDCMSNVSGQYHNFSDCMVMEVF